MLSRDRAETDPGGDVVSGLPDRSKKGRISCSDFLGLNKRCVPDAFPRFKGESVR
jgi:hypothetical protein